MSNSVVAATPPGAAPPQAAPPDDRCPRCGGGFHCGVADAAPCPCRTIRLDAATQAALRQRYSGCLCQRCLADLSRAGPGATAPLR